MLETFTITNKKRFNIIFKGQNNYLLQSTEKYYKLYLRALQKYIIGEITTLANNTFLKDKEKYTFKNF